MSDIADIVIKNAEIYSVDLKNELSVNQAIAVKGSLLAYVGDNSGVESYIDKNTAVYDLKGGTILPGLCDTHLHASMTVEMVSDIQLYDIMPDGEFDRDKLIQKYKDAIRAQIDGRNDIKVVRCVGWNPTFFAADPLGQPTADDLAGVCDDIPLIMRSYCHHFLWVNRKALDDSGINKDTETPKEGIICRDADGNPTGVFQETTAEDLLIESLPYGDYSVSEYKEGIRLYQQQFGNNYGTVLVFDALISKNALCAYQEMAKDDELTMRVRTCFLADPSKPFSQFDDIVAQKEKYKVGDVFDVRTVKFFIDGSALAFYMEEPFEAEYLAKIGLPRDFRGTSQWSLAELCEAFLKLDSAGFQIHIHCMGDAATALSLDAFEYVSRKNDIQKNRHVITHLMQVSENDLKRMKEMGIIASIQPIWGLYDSSSEAILREMFGDERADNQYPYGTIIKEGIISAAGTDFPVTLPPDPFCGIHVGMTRRFPKGHPEYEIYKDKPMGPSSDVMKNAAGLEDMVSIYTIWGAYQLFLEDSTGSLEVGKSADFVVLDKTLSKLTPDEIANTKPVKTYFKGKEVYSVDKK